MNQNGHLTSDERTAYWQRTLAPPALFEVCDHLQECARCRAELLAGKPAAASGEAVPYEELAAWMEEELDPPLRRDLGGRIAQSPQASAELADLLRFRDEMNETPAHDYSLEESPAMTRSSWILPIAAGLALGLAFLWWNSTERNSVRGLALNDAGKHIVVRQDGQVPALGALPPDLQQAVYEATSLGKIPLAPVLAQLRGLGETLAGATPSPTAFAAIAPVGTVVESARPTLRWSQRPGATGYRVNLAPKKGGAVITSPLLGANQTEWTPPALLQPNEIYEREIEAVRDGEMVAKAPAPPEPEARFAVLPNEKLAKVRRLREQFGRSHLLMGLAYARAGLVSEARTEFEKLARENPQSELPRQLLARLTNP